MLRFLKKLKQVPLNPAKLAPFVLRTVTTHLKGRRCRCCGILTVQSFSAVYWPELIAAMELTPDWVRYYDLREGQTCSACYLNLRAQHVAQTIVEVYNRRLGTKAISLAELCSEPSFQSIRIAEVNDCCGMHKWLKELPLLSYSEYASGDPSIRHEDVLSLSYPDEAFDLVINSDSLEHVPDFERALSEIHRVLKPSGMHIFTIPIVGNIKSRKRAQLEGGRIVHLLPPVYHGPRGTGSEDLLACSDFGPDVFDLIRTCGFRVRVAKDRHNPALITIVTTKVVPSPTSHSLAHRDDDEMLDSLGYGVGL
jgi:SAM-dependent methyltransferase